MKTFHEWVELRSFLEAAEIVHIGDSDFMDDDDGNQDELVQRAWEIAKQSPIRILSDKDLSSVALMGGIVAGALFTGWRREEFSFDVIVSPQFQRQGVATQLIDAAISECNQGGEAFPDAHIKADVVNPYLVPLLQRRGFVMKQQVGGHTIMTRQ